MPISFFENGGYLITDEANILSVLANELLEKTPIKRRFLQVVNESDTVIFSGFISIPEIRKKINSRNQETCFPLEK